MKQWFLAMAMAALGIGGLQAQQVIRKAAVPAPVVEEFEYRFVNAQDITWLKQGEEYYGARFHSEGSDFEAVYTPTGEWVQTEQDIAYLDMPEESRKYCRSYYPDYQAKTVQKVSTRKHGILYEIKVVDGLKAVDITFDMHGRLLKENEQEYTPAEEAPQETMREKMDRLFGKSED